MNVGNLSGIAVCLFLLLWLYLYAPLRRRAERAGKLRLFRGVHRALLALFGLGFAWAAVLTGCMVYGASSAPPPGATAVVLGSQVRGTYPSLDLWARINAAADYLRANPDAVCVASGGQGEGEQISEAQAIKENLVKLGISADRIFLEDASTNTRENLENSSRLIDEHGLNREIALVTDEYHQFRAGLAARRAGLSPHAVCAKTPWYIFSACYAREMLAITGELLR